MNQGYDRKNPEVEMFVSELTRHQSYIYSYIISFIANFNDADDLMQETTKMMWERFGEFKPGTNFKAWGIRIAHFRILEYFNRRKKEKKSFFSDQLIDEIAVNVEKKLDESKEYLVFLNKCIEKLSLRDKDMVRLKYQKKLRVKEIAVYFGKSVQSIYQNIGRIHEQLQRCVKRQAFD